MPHHRLDPREFRDRIVTPGGNAIQCPSCNGELPPSALRCVRCGRDLSARDGSTSAASLSGLPLGSPGVVDALPISRPPHVTRPDPDEQPPHQRRWDAALIGLVILGGVILNVPFHRVDRAARFVAWTGACAALLDVAPGQRAVQHWHTTEAWPPEGDLPLLRYESARATPVADALVKRIGIAVQERGRWPVERMPVDPSGRRYLEAPGRGRGLVIVVVDAWHGLSLELAYFSPTVTSGPAFECERGLGLPGLYGAYALHLVLVALGAFGVRSALTALHRRRRWREYRASEAADAALRTEAKGHLDRAEAHAAEDRKAQALVEVNAALRLLPEWRDAQLLKAQLHDQAPDSLGRGIATRRNSDVVYLRVMGTPYAYQALPGARIITVGRQRLDGDRPANDVVIRVPASDDRSLRISRRHLEIQEIDGEFFIIDRSSGGTLLNGRTLARDSPRRISSGDLLRIGGVLSVEFLVRAAALRAQRVPGEVALGEKHERMNLEATIGDLVTVIDNDGDGIGI